MITIVSLELWFQIHIYQPVQIIKKLITTHINEIDIIFFLQDQEYSSNLNDFSNNTWNMFIHVLHTYLQHIKRILVLFYFLGKYEVKFTEDNQKSIVSIGDIALLV